MGDGFGYGGVPYPIWLPRQPQASTPPYLATHPVESYGGFDPMTPHGSYSDPSSSFFYTQPGNFGSCKDSAGRYYPSMETSSDLPPMEKQRVPYSSATVSYLADMLIRNSQEPFYIPIPPSGVCASSNAFDLNRHYSGYGKHESMNAAVSVEPFVPVPSSLKTEALFNGSQTGDGRSFPENIISSLHGSSVEPVYQTLRDGTVCSTDSRSPWSSQPLQFDAKSSGKRQGSGENCVSESSLKSAICDEHRSGNHFLVSPSAPTMFSTGSESLVAMKAGPWNAAQSDVQASQKTFKLQEQLVDRDNKATLLTDLSIKGSSRTSADDFSTRQSTLGDFPSPDSSPRVSSVVNAMHNLSQVLVYECFSNRSWLKPEQLENLDKVVENLTKCLKKITTNKTIAGEASLPTQVIHVSCPNVVDLNEASNVVAKDCQRFNVKPLDSFGFKESVDKDKDEMTRSIKNILASNFPDDEENHPQTLLYKNLWLETEAALCSTTCLARYHRIQNETGNLKLQKRDISADASTFMQEPLLNPKKSDSIMNIVEQETTESFIKDGSNCGNTVVTMSHHDAPQSSRFNSDPVDAVLSLMSRSFAGGLEQENHGNFKPGARIPDAIRQESTTEEKYNDVIDRFQILKQKETKRKLQSQSCPDPDVGVIDRFQILKQQETNRKLKSQDCSEKRMDEQEDNPEALEMATIGRSSHMSDVMGRFHLLKRREAEQVLNSLDLDSDSGSDFDSDSDYDQPRNKTHMYDSLCSGSMMAIGGNSKIETCANTEPSADGKGYESPTSDWEHVLKDD